jgi:hypothetical protein
MCSPKALSIGLVTTSVVMLVLAFIAVPTVNLLVHTQIKADIPVSSAKSILYPIWMDPKDDVTIIMTYYLYTCTNPFNVREKGERPQIQAVGPFSYRERRVKWNVEFVDGNTALNYVYNRTFHYIDTPCNTSEPLDNQVCSLPEDTEVTIVNVPLIGVLNQVKYVLSNDTKTRKEEAFAIDTLLAAFGGE